MGPKKRLIAMAATLAMAILLPTMIRAETPIPAFSDYVVDTAGMFSAGAKDKVNHELGDLEARSGIQFAVLTVPSLQGESMLAYSVRAFRTWGLGTKGKDDGLLLVFARNEHQDRFTPGRHLEQSMTDLQSKLILHEGVRPLMAAGDDDAALEKAVSSAITVMTADQSQWPEWLKASQNAKQDDGATSVLWVFAVAGIALVGIAFLMVLFNSVSDIRSGGRRRRRGSWLDWLPITTGSSGGSSSSDSSIWSSGSGGGGGSGGGSDGFSGGGGGDTGGGGASDGW